MTRTLRSLCIYGAFLLSPTLTLAFQSADGIGALKPRYLIELQKQFSLSRQEISLNQLKGTWNCQIFGARSFKQVLIRKSLYVFNTPSKWSATNTGNHLFKSYTFKKDELVAQKGHLTDVLRLTKEGLLIGETSVSEQSVPPQALRGMPSNYLKNRVILSFSRCSK